MTDGPTSGGPFNFVLGPDEPVMELWEAAFSWGRGMKPHQGTERGNVRSSNAGNVRRTPRPTCAFCGALTKLIGRRLFCRDCGYFESCCDGGKEAIEGGEC